MSVRELYEEFPFPYRGNHGDLVAKYVVPAVPFTPSSILDAGCGTGNLTLDTARSFPGAKVFGIDFSDASLARARELAREAQAQNLEFSRHDLSEPFPPGPARGPHRFVMSIGCIHHTPDPKLSLRNLRPTVSADGLFLLAVYGKRGRIEIELRRSLVDHIRQTTGKSNRELLDLYGELATEASLANNRLRKVPPLTLGYFAQRGLEKVQAKLSSRGSVMAAVSTEVGDADQFLHPLVHNWSAREWVEALESAGFEVERFIHDAAGNGWCIPENPVERLQSEELKQILRQLPLKDRYEALDLLYRPLLNFILCRPNALFIPS
jgi:SAM-dependent methyltransferase